MHGIRLALATVSLLAAALLAPGAAWAADEGDLDESFGAGGVVATALGADKAPGFGVATDAQGRVLVAGYRKEGTTKEAIVSRFRADGGLDAGFGSGGVVVLPFGPENAEAVAVAVDSAGRIVVAGQGYDSGTHLYRFAVARLAADGGLDPTFGEAGVARIGRTDDDLFTESMAIDSQGRIAVGGFGLTDGLANDKFVVARLDRNGDLETGFGDEGFAIATFAGSNDRAHSIAVDSQDRIVAAGFSESGDREVAVARFTSGGQLDPSFDIDGRAFYNGGGMEEANGVAVDSQDRPVIAGRVESDHFAVARLEADGYPDPSFGSAGVSVAPLGEIAYGVAIDPQGRIVAAGRNTPGFEVARFLADGELDEGFGSGGGTQTVIGGGSIARALALDGAGRAVLAGESYGSDALALARYLNAPRTTIVSGPQGLTQYPGARFEFGSPDSPSGFQCSLDGASFSSCSSPSAYGSLADGAHSFRVRAVGITGRVVDPTPAARSFTVDLTPPATTLTGHPGAVTHSRTVEFTYTSDDAAATSARSTARSSSARAATWSSAT